MTANRIRLILMTIVLLLTSVAVYSQGKYPFTSKRPITTADLQGKSPMELKIMRNEIVARHGYIFKTDDMKAYFGKQSWYSPKLADVTALLSPVERENYDLIKKYEATPPSQAAPAAPAVRQTRNAPATQDGSLYPQASSRALSPDELSQLSKQELKLMRNEIFARHGYIFKTKDMQDHFGSQSWYSPTSSDVTSKLTPIEKQNIELIKQYEAMAK